MSWLAWLCGAGSRGAYEPPGGIPPAPKLQKPRNRDKKYCVQCNGTGVTACPACLAFINPRNPYSCSACHGGLYSTCSDCDGSGLAPKKHDHAIHVPRQLLTSLGIDADYVRSVTLRFEANECAKIDVEYLCQNDHMRAVSGDLRKIVRDIVEEGIERGYKI